MTNLWQQIADNKLDYIGATLSNGVYSTVVRDITVKGGFFEIHGDRFGFGFDVDHSLPSRVEDDGVRFIGATKEHWVMGKSTKQEGLELEA